MKPIHQSWKPINIGIAIGIVIVLLFGALAMSLEKIRSTKADDKKTVLLNNFQTEELKKSDEKLKKLSDEFEVEAYNKQVTAKAYAKGAGIKEEDLVNFKLDFTEDPKTKAKVYAFIPLTAEEIAKRDADVAAEKAKQKQ